MLNQLVSNSDGIWINFTTTIIATIVAGIFLLIVEHWIVQPIKDENWWRKLKSVFLIKHFLAILSLIIPVLIAKDYLIAIIEHLPFENEVRLDIHATLLAVIAVIWGVLWGALIRPRLFSSLEEESES